jgi:hypothetical protein
MDARSPATGVSVPQPNLTAYREAFRGMSRLGEGNVCRPCHLTEEASVSAPAGIRTPRTSTIGAERNARFARIASIGGQVPGRSRASSRG